MGTSSHQYKVLLLAIVTLNAVACINDAGFRIEALGLTALKLNELFAEPLVR